MSKKKKLSILCTIYNRCEKRTENWEVSIPEKVLECLKLSLIKFRAMENIINGITKVLIIIWRGHKFGEWKIAIWPNAIMGCPVTGS